MKGYYAVNKEMVKIDTLEDAKKAHTLLVLHLLEWNKYKAAEALGIDRRTLYRMLERWKMLNE